MGIRLVHPATDGVYEAVDQDAADVLAESGWLPASDSNDGAAAHPTDALDEMTVAQLQDFAAAHGIDLGDASRKADIADAIRTHQSTPPA